MRKLAYRLLAFSLAVLPAAAHAQPRPFGNVTLEQLIGNIIRALIGAMGSVSLVMFVYGGFLWMTAQGSDERVKKAKSTLLYSTLGIIVAFMSYAAVAFVLSTLQTVTTAPAPAK